MTDEFNFVIQILLVYTCSLGIPEFAKALLVDRGHADQSILFHALKVAISGGTGGSKLPKLPNLESVGYPVAIFFAKRRRANLLQTQRQEKFGTHNFMLHDWPEYNGRWMS